MEKVTKKMDLSLVEIYKMNSVSSVNKSTLKALRSRFLLNEDNNLSDLGKRYVISKMPLINQCSELSLNYEVINLPYDGNPEPALLGYFNSLGYIGVSCEGTGILTVLKALMLDKLAYYNTFNSREDACTRYLEAQLKIQKDNISEIISSISSVNKNKYISNFKEIISTSRVGFEYPEVTTEFASAMYDAIDLELFISIAKKISEDPYQYRNGWPDLTLVKGREVLFIEVKTKDRLHDSQLITIPVMRNIIPFEFSVKKVIR